MAVQRSELPGVAMKKALFLTLLSWGNQYLIPNDEYLVFKSWRTRYTRKTFP